MPREQYRRYKFQLEVKLWIYVFKKKKTNLALSAAGTGKMSSRSALWNSSAQCAINSISSLKTFLFLFIQMMLEQTAITCNRLYEIFRMHAFCFVLWLIHAVVYFHQAFERNEVKWTGKCWSYKLWFWSFFARTPLNNRQKPTSFAKK